MRRGRNAWRAPKNVCVGDKQPGQKTPATSKFESSNFLGKQEKWGIESLQLPTALDFRYILILFSESGSFMPGNPRDSMQTIENAARKR